MPQGNALTSSPSNSSYRNDYRSPRGRTQKTQPARFSSAGPAAQHLAPRPRNRAAPASHDPELPRHGLPPRTSPAPGLRRIRGHFDEAGFAHRLRPGVHGAGVVFPGLFATNFADKAGEGGGEDEPGRVLRVLFLVSCFLFLVSCSRLRQ